MDSLLPHTPSRDPEFERLASCRMQHTPDEELAESMRRKPPVICTWQGYVLLSYREWLLCRLYNIPYATDPRPFICREEAVIYICETILAEGTDNAHSRKYLLGKLYTAMKFLRQKARGTELYERLFPTGALTIHLFKARYGTGEHTVKSARDFAAGIDAVAEKSPILAVRILSGDVFFTLPDLLALPRINERTFFAYAASPKNRALRQKMRQEVKRVREHPEEVPKPKESVPKYEPQIKQMPAYDPDAELRSITLTIPAWTRSLRRAGQKTAFPRTSAEARMHFRQAMYTLKEAILETEHLMEETRYEYR